MDAGFQGGEQDVRPTVEDAPQTRELLGAYLRGDRSALGRLLLEHEPYVRRVIESRLDDDLRRHVQTSDVIRETRMDVVRRIDDFFANKPIPFRLWLRTAACERMAQLRDRYLNSNSQSEPHEFPLPDQSALLLADQFVNQETCPLQIPPPSQRATFVRRALANLAEPDREVLLARYVEQLSNAEMALLLDMDQSAASRRRERAVMRLQRAITRLSDADADR